MTSISGSDFTNRASSIIPILLTTSFPLRSQSFEALEIELVDRKPGFAVAMVSYE